MQQCKNCSRVCVSLCTTVVHNTAQSCSDYLFPYPLHQHQSAYAVYWRGGNSVKTNARDRVSEWQTGVEGVGRSVVTRRTTRVFYGALLLTLFRRERQTPRSTVAVLTACTSHDGRLRPRPVITPPAAAPPKSCPACRGRVCSGREWWVAGRWPLPQSHCICTIM